eukprot:365747-Chlamydomonas_euryale.AAC.73
MYKANSSCGATTTAHDGQGTTIHGIKSSSILAGWITHWTAELCQHRCTNDRPHNRPGPPPRREPAQSSVAIQVHSYVHIHTNCSWRGRQQGYLRAP